MRVGVYGGTFDPIHIGHLAIAEEVRHTLGLQQVRFIPAAHQPLKDDPPQASASHRLAMVRLACADNPAFVPDDCELRRPPPSYTIATLEHLRAELGPSVELWLVIGADAARELPRWHRIDAILDLARLAIMARPGCPFEPAALEQAVPASVGRYMFLDGPHLDLSSTDLRRRLAMGRPIRYLTPDSVRQYIVEHSLYRETPIHG